MVRKRTVPAIFLGAAWLAGCAGPWILSGYKSYTGVNGGNRRAEHAGVDFGAPHGAPVIAAADGELFYISRTSGCGLGVDLYHPALKRHTVYCHLSKEAANAGDIKRGEVIGYIGTTGNAAGVPHVHFEVTLDGRSHRSGDLSSTEDPSKYFVGCYDTAASYKPGEMAYPTPCKDRKNE